MKVKDKLTILNKAGFSVAFIAKNTRISYDRIYNAANDRTVRMAPTEFERIDTFFEIAMRLINVGGEE